MSHALRNNTNKLELSRIPADALEAEAEVWMKGADKYPDDEGGNPNWEKLWGDRTLKICLDSLERHALELRKKKFFDKETGCHHAAHIRCNAAMIIRYVNQLMDCTYSIGGSDRNKL